MKLSKASRHLVGRAAISILLLIMSFAGMFAICPGCKNVAGAMEAVLWYFSLTILNGFVSLYVLAVAIDKRKQLSDGIFMFGFVPLILLVVSTAVFFAEVNQH